MSTGDGVQWPFHHCMPRWPVSTLQMETMDMETEAVGGKSYFPALLRTVKWNIGGRNF